MRFVFEIQILEPEVAASIIAAVAAVATAFISGFFLLRAARIQAPHEQSGVPKANGAPASRRNKHRHGRRPAKKSRSP